MSPSEVARAAFRGGLDAFNWWQRCGANIVLIVKRVFYALIAVGTIWTASNGTLGSIVTAARAAAETAVNTYVESHIVRHLEPVVKRIEELQGDIVSLRSEFGQITPAAMSSDLAAQLARIEAKLDGMKKR